MSPDVRQLLWMDGRVPAESLLAESSFHQRGRCVGGGAAGCLPPSSRPGPVRCARGEVITLCLAAGSRKAEATGRVWSSSGQRLISINCPISSSFVGSVNGPRAGMDPTQSRHQSCPIILQAPSVNLQRFCRMKSGQRRHAPTVVSAPPYGPAGPDGACPGGTEGAALPRSHRSPGWGRLTPHTCFKARVRGSAHFL